MSISRKEFLFRGIYTFGRDIIEGLLVSPSGAAETKDVKDHRHLVLDNGRCLAQRGGCFACIDHCPKAAVTIDLGRGVAIDQELCDGCGECAAVCPIDPKVIIMKSSEAESITSRKGDANEEDSIDSCCSRR